LPRGERYLTKFVLYPLAKLALAHIPSLGAGGEGNHTVP
jgi:hypothetical protein